MRGLRAGDVLPSTEPGQELLGILLQALRRAGAVEAGEQRLSHDGPRDLLDQTVRTLLSMAADTPTVAVAYARLAAIPRPDREVDR